MTLKIFNWKVRHHWYLMIIFAVFVCKITSAETTSKSRNRRASGWITGPSQQKVFPTVNPEALLESKQFEAEMNKLVKMNFSEKMEQILEAEKETKSVLQNFIETVKNRLESLEESVYPDEVNYWAESDSCGGVLVSQTGKISHKADSLYEPHEKCIWIIRTNYRYKVKVQLTKIGFEEDGYDYLAITELNRNNEQHTTKLTRKGTYLFEGPLLLVTFMTDFVGSGTGFTLEFEGIGRNINKDINYRHFYTSDWNGSFSSDNITANEHEEDFKLDDDESKQHSTDFTTVILNPNYKDVSQLHVTVSESSLMLQPTNECEKTSLTIFENFLDDNTPKNRCCGTKCDSFDSLNDEGYVLVTFQSVPKSLSKFDLEWKIDENVPRANSVDTCGGTVSGRLGRISYKKDSEYKNNERCVWAIKSTGKAKIKVILRSEEFEDGYDYVYVSYLHENWEMHNLRLRQHLVHNFTGPVVFVTFYSDGSTQGKGFELDWAEFGEEASTTSNDPLYFDQDSGTLMLALDPPVFQFVIINPKYLDGSSLKLKFISLEPQLTANSTGLYLYGNDEENFTLAQKYSNEGEGTVPEEFGAVGGVFILIFKAEVSQDVRNVEFAWMKAEGCGGVLVGDAGLIEYKLTSAYESNSRCVWTIESSRLSKLSFKLVKDGFEGCCDFLIAKPLHTENGTLGESVIINRLNKVKSFSEPVVFIVFYSDGSLGTHGFRLEFSSSGTELGEGRTHFVHNFYKEVNGTHKFMQLAPDENNLEKEQVNKSTYKGPEIFTNVVSPQNDDGELRSVKMTLEMNQFRSDKECHHDSLSFFQIQNPKEGSSSTPRTFTCSDPKNTTDCECAVASKAETFFMKDAAFISIFKPLQSNGKASFTYEWTVANSDEPAYVN